MPIVATRTFDTGTVGGMLRAERYKARLQEQYDKVIVELIGLNRVRITGTNVQTCAKANHVEGTK